MFQHLTDRTRTTLLVLAGLVPVVFYYAALYRQSLPVPILDDFDAILNFLDQQRQLPDLPARLLAILEFQHGDYRWVVPHLLMAAQTALTGHPSFSFYILVGNVFMLPAGMLLWLHSFPQEPLPRRMLLFLPVVYLLFQFTYVEMLDFASAGVQFLMLPLVVGSLHLLLRGTARAFSGACLCAVLACGTAPQGFLLAPLGFALLVAARKPGRAALWTVTFCVTLYAYLFRYAPAPPAVPGPAISYVLFFVSFVGGTIENMHREPVPYAAVGLGLLLCATFLHSIRTGYFKTHRLLFLTAVWAYMTAILITYARQSLGVAQSLSARYKLFSSVLMALAYLYWAHRLHAQEGWSVRSKRTIQAVALGLSILFCLAADGVGYRFLQRRYDRTLDAYGYYRQDPQHHAPYVNFYINGRENGEADLELTALRRAIASGLYAPPALPLH